MTFALIWRGARQSSRRSNRGSTQCLDFSGRL